MPGWMWRGRGKAHRSTGVAMTGLDEIFHPEAARAREFIEVQHEMCDAFRLTCSHQMVVPLPGAGDQSWDDGWTVIDLPDRPGDGPMEPRR